ncbi:MAG: NAD(P)(+) transhydrogenase (Re/Si-specific) subunit alpha, partial [Kordiimonadaceae bacterium]|nr:NAD(P)(+) transhydrogenase (Re/Si-specific) subunit alpha [Kordiimonadaceae bacterium]
MKITIPKERRQHEKRVAATPDTVKKYIALGFNVSIEKDAGKASQIMNNDYQDAGATIVDDVSSIYKDADIILKVQKPMMASEGELDEVSLIKKGTILISTLDPMLSPEHNAAYAAGNIAAFSMEFMPRISRAQSMDVLSSQSNLAGYNAVIDAAHHYGRAFPMMMTAAGTVAPAKVMIMGVGVAGLQAIATAKRLGAVVSATDVRSATKEQVESLGGKFIMVE